jgi:ElaA protein
MNWFLFPFADLSPNDLHDLIALRINVFVVEQNCPYPELDGKDKKSIHLFARNETGELVACARILPPGISYKEASIGRVCTAQTVRRSGAGVELMNRALTEIKNHFGDVPVKISAQQYLERFYSSFGLKPLPSLISKTIFHTLACFALNTSSLK